MEEGIVENQEEVVEQNKNEFSEQQSGTAMEEASSQPENQEVVGKGAEDSGVRYDRLKVFDKVMEKSMNKFIEDASVKGFSRIFHPLYKKNPQKMENIHKQFTEELKKAMQEDINKLVEEGMLKFKLNELDKLENAAKNKPEPTWRPSGVPQEDFCSFLMPIYLKQEAYMQRELKKIRAENAALAQKVLTGRESIAHTEQCISKTVDEWKTSVSEFERLASFLGPSDVFNE